MASKMSVMPEVFMESSEVKTSIEKRQHFGRVVELKDLLEAQIVNKVDHTPANYIRCWTLKAEKKDTGSTVSFNKTTYQACLDVKQFQPEELFVSVAHACCFENNKYVIVRGVSTQKQEGSSKVFRKFERKYLLPINCDINNANVKLTWDGVLMITVPRVKGSGGERTVETWEDIENVERPVKIVLSKD
ncbi:hypothetical protein NQ315_014995 [Exocentrus adspersus]|uniref:SHSP domain-containing protein n=1 Tax=Exocentrus adspersus TaxID=1586481 RepID=A0AAV8VWZ6_9CUCU|nr:hypothetical protein NQ315_014995 [Exocentrus adspersus]